MRDEIKEEERKEERVRRKEELEQAKIALDEAQKAYDVSRGKRYYPLRNRRDTPENMATVDDICFFLADRLADRDGQKLPYSVVKSFVTIVFNLIGDLLVEHSWAKIEGFGTFYTKWRQPATDYYVKILPDEELQKRINVTGKKLTIQRSNVIDEIREARTARNERNDRWLENDMKRRQRQEADDE